MQIDWNPQGVVEKAGDLLGFDERSVKKDLAHFKEFIEARPTETGAWREDVPALVTRLPRSAAHLLRQVGRCRPGTRMSAFDGLEAAPEGEGRWRVVETGRPASEAAIATVTGGEHQGFALDRRVTRAARGPVRHPRRRRGGRRDVAARALPRRPPLGAVCRILDDVQDRTSVRPASRTASCGPHVDPSLISGRIRHAAHGSPPVRRPLVASAADGNRSRSSCVLRQPRARCPPTRETRADDPVPMLRFLVGSGRAVAAVVRFLIEVARADGPDPIDLTPRILRTA